MKYPLLPYSQLVFDLQKINPDVYTSRSVVRLQKRDVDIVRLQSAVEQAIRNHPVFQMHVDTEGMQQLEPLEDVLLGQFHSVDFVDHGEYVDVHVKGNRILGDGRSDVIIIEDIIRAYQGLPLLPGHYLNYLQKVEKEKRSARYEANRQWLEFEYGHLSCPVHPKTDSPIKETDVPIEGMFPEDYSDIRDSYVAFAGKQLLSLTAVFSLASALAMMEYNGTDAAALTWAYDGRETAEEQRIYGSLHRDVPFQISRKSKVESQKKDLIRETRKQFREGIAHSSYPFTLTYPFTKTWNYALNVLVQPSMLANIPKVPFAFEDVTPKEEPHIAYSLLDVEIYDAEQLIVNYRYSATHYKEESIKKFAALVRKYAEWLLE